MAAPALDIDGTRGIFSFWIPWGPAVGIAFPAISIAVWKSTDGAPAAWDPANPANELAGRIGLPVAAGASRSTVATNIAAKILLMLTHLGVLTKFHQLGGAVIPDSPLAWLGVGTVAIVSPRGWRRSELVHQTGAFNITQRIFVAPATVRPILLAGIRPAPWMIVGGATEGQGDDRGPVGGEEGSGSPEPVPLLTAGNYAILAKTGVTNVPTSDINGFVGVSPAAAVSITGLALVLDGGGAFATSAQVTGEVFAADYVAPTPATLTQAVLDMQAAYADAAGRTPDFTELHGGLFNGETLLPAVYKFSTGVAISGDITLQGGPADVFIFEIAGVLSLAANKKIILAGGLPPGNVIWQVAGNVAIGVGATFNGTILCLTDITIGAGSIMLGRCLAQTAVNLNSVTLN